MAYGDSPDDVALRGAWAEFCKRLQEAGDKVFKDINPPNPLQRADAFRFLTQNLGQAFDLALETKDAAYPLIHPFCTPTRKLGGDAADFTYRQAWINGEHVYRIVGKMGTARFFNITVQGPRSDINPSTGLPSLHEPFGDVPEANLFKHQIVTAVDGSFEIFIGGEKRSTNWLPTTPQSRKLFIREGFDSWEETPTMLSIERIGMNVPRPMPTPQVIIDAIDWAGKFLTGMMRDWPDHPYQFSGGVVDPAYPNQFPPDRSANTAEDAKRGRVAANLCWTIKRDEALIIEFNAHDGFWMVALGGVFMSSFDYLYRSVSFTPARTKVDSDGKVRLILCSDDPGYHNWLDSQGFECGNLIYRNLMSNARTEFRTQFTKRLALSHVLPSGAVTLSKDERTTQLQTRFRSIKQRYGL
jgi:hypothetical protein